MIQVYRFMYLLLKMVLIVFRPFFATRTQEWITMRFAVQSAKFENLNLINSIWIHASSGEIEYAKDLIRELKRKYPDRPIVVTYSSASAEKLFENIRNSVDFFVPLPWDDVYSISQFIKKIDPALLIISRTDLWPEMIYQCSNKKISIGLISYFPFLSFWNRWYLKNLLSKFQFVSCVDQKTKLKIRALLGPSSTVITADGDTRFDQVFFRLSQNSKIEILSNSPVFTFGSTWPEDEENCEKFWSYLLQNNHRLIISPHDVSLQNVERLCLWLKQKNYSFRKLSDFDSNIDFNFPILLVDRIGILADIYRFSNFAFVGGSFKSRVHSVMEPLCCGIPVFVGPLIKNSPEAVRYSHHENFLLVARDAKDLIAEHMRIQNLDIAALNSQIKIEMQKNRGATQKIIRLISDSFLRKVNS